MNSLPIIELHEMQLLLFVHKCMYHRELLPSIFNDYFRTMHSVHCQNTRRQRDLFVGRFTSNLGQRCSVYKCSRLWNQLPDDLKRNSSFAVFKGTSEFTR